MTLLKIQSDARPDPWKQHIILNEMGRKLAAEFKQPAAMQRDKLALR